MKQKLLLLAMALLGLSGTAMADGITFSGEIQEGKFGLITIYSHVESKHYNGFEIHIKGTSIPEGITIESVVPTNELKETYPDIDIKHNMNEDNGYYVVMGMTMDSATEYLPIGDNPIVKVYLKADNSFKKGDKVNLEVDHGEFAQVGESQSVHFIGTEFGKENVTVPLEVVTAYTAERTIDAESKYEIEESYGGYEENITFKRNFKKDKWATLCLPFSLTADEAWEIFGDDVESATLNKKFKYNADNKLITLQLDEEDIINEGLTANTLYFIKTADDINEFRVENKVVAPINVTATTTVTINRVTYPITGFGVYKYQAIPKNGIFLNDNAFYYSVGTSNVKATRGYLVLDNYFFSEDGAGANIIFTIDDEPTAIEGLSTTNYRPNDAVYSISGVYMGKASDMKKLPRGMYIVNNKKVTVK